MNTLTKERLEYIERQLDDYWELDYIDADISNEMQGYAWELLVAYKKLTGVIENG